MADHWVVGNPSHWNECPASGNIRQTLQKILGIINIFTGASYLIYRAWATISTQCHPLMVLHQTVFYLLELVAYLQIWFRVVETWGSLTRNSIDFDEIPRNTLAKMPNIRNESESEENHFRKLPSINIYVPCYKEDTDIVHSTVKAALSICYPQNLLSVYLCDDGKDPAKKNLINKLQDKLTSEGNKVKLEYMTRPDNKHAKAGNLNHALRKTYSDLIIVLDADFIAYPDLINRLLSYYYYYDKQTSTYRFDYELAFVQTPQRFRNLSPYDFDTLDQRSIMFFDYFLPARDYHNASTIVGTTNLINRRALDVVGLFPTHSVTEDTALSIEFHSNGYKGYYVNETLATGLATPTLHGFISQRNRYAKGDFQIFFSSKGPLTCRGLSFRQRLCYIQMAMSRITSIMYLLFDFFLLLLLVFSISPLYIKEPKLFLLFWGSYMLNIVMVEASIVWNGNGFLKSSSASSILEILFRLKIILSFYNTVFRRKCVKFKVTTKIERRKPQKITESEEEFVDLENSLESSQTDSESDEEFAYGSDVLQNLKATWTSTASLVLYIFSIIWALVMTPDPEKFFEIENNTKDVNRFSFLLTVIAVAYGIVTMVGQYICLFICFQPFLKDFDPQSNESGYKRFDQYIKTESGSLRVPFSPIGLYHWVKLIFLLASVTVFAVYIFLGP